MNGCRSRLARSIFLHSIIKSIKISNDDAELAESIKIILSIDFSKMFILLQILGLTRNKILTDARAAKTPNVPSSSEDLPFSGAWRFAGPYLALRARRVLGTLSVPANHALEALNQATYPGYIRQERAKRQGHEAEGRLARLLLSFGLNFSPKQKANNPLTSDIRINNISFDLVMPDALRPTVLVKSTVQTANIGQFGESKGGLEIEEAKRMIVEKFDYKPVLLALVDGIGFKSNSSGLNAILATADEFCQFRTIWKAVILSAASERKRVRLFLPGARVDSEDNFLRRWSKSIILLGSQDAELLPTGDGFAQIIDR